LKQLAFLDFFNEESKQWFACQAEDADFHGQMRSRNLEVIRFKETTLNGPIAVIGSEEISWEKILIRLSQKSSLGATINLNEDKCLQ
jgi:hypothetical protein